MLVLSAIAFAYMTAPIIKAGHQDDAVAAKEEGLQPNFQS